MPVAPSLLSKPERYLDGLRAHPLLGGCVRFYFRYREQLLYLVVGGWNTLFGYAVWALMQFLLGDYLPYLVVLLLSWPVAVLNNYVCYRYIVFRTRGAVWKEFPRFSLVYVATLCFNLLVLPLALRVAPFNIYVVQALLTLFVIICSYVANRYFAFQAHKPNCPSETPVIQEWPRQTENATMQDARKDDN